MHFGSFRCCTKLGAKWAELVYFCKSLCHEVLLELFATNAPDTNHGTQNSCFVAFRNVWVHYCTKLGAKWAELVQLMQKSMPRSRVGTFSKNSPDPHHGTLNSCFVAFRNLWVHLVPFCYCNKLGAKWAELVQKFLPRSRVGTFHYERTRYTPWDRKLMFCCIS